VKVYSAAQTSYEQWPESLQKILVVDDDESVCMVLTRVLQGAGHDVAVARNGPEAIDTLRSESFDLIITDLKMPGIDGLGVLEKAKELDPLCEVIVITGYASVDSAVEVMRLGAYDYITKPFNLDRIRILAERALQRRRLLQAAAETEAYKRLSQLDGMTEALNRRGFDELLSAEISRSRRFGRPISLLMIDLDDLKVINDSYGHQAGDKVLKEIASMLKKSVRQCDIVARYGGDEFAVILVETGKVDAMLKANLLRDSLATPGHTNGIIGVQPKHTTTISIGVASYPIDARTVEGLVREADRALYGAKARGGSSVEAANP
jgi:two-component system cell cycle response regulator